MNAVKIFSPEIFVLIIWVTLIPPTEQVYRHYYHYYRRRVAPQVDIRVVVGVVITVVSVVQYLGWWHSYHTAVTAALRMPRYVIMLATNW